MTRLATLADIHGNLLALEVVLADLAQSEIDQVIVAGDVINWGPFSAPVMARVAAAGWARIRGNNEDYLLDYATPRAPCCPERRLSLDLLVAFEAADTRPDTLPDCRLPARLA